MMPLGLLGAGEKAEVLEVCGMHPVSSNSSLQQYSKTCRIEDMGIRIGKTVEMLNNEGRGALLVRIDETRLALGRGMAMKIIVRKK